MDKPILVFGSYVTDLCGRASRFPLPGETVKGHYFKMGPGGKGSNQAVAAKRAGGDVTFVTKLGNDALGQQAIEFYKAEGMMNSGILVDDSEQTGAALIMVDEGSAQNQILVASGACGSFTEADMPPILQLVEKADFVLLQLETNLLPVKAILRYAKQCGCTTVLNPAPACELPEEYYRYVDIITPNETEAHFLTGVQVTDAASAQLAAERLGEMGVQCAVITMGALGSFVWNSEETGLFGIVDCGPPVDSTGAGDAFNGGLVTALARGLSLSEAVTYASIVAGIAVTRHGTAPAMPYKAEVDAVYQKRKE